MIVFIVIKHSDVIFSSMFGDHKPNEIISHSKYVLQLNI